MRYVPRISVVMQQDIRSRDGRVPAAAAGRHPAAALDVIGVSVVKKPVAVLVHHYLHVHPLGIGPAPTAARGRRRPFPVPRRTSCITRTSCSIITLIAISITIPAVTS